MKNSSFVAALAASVCVVAMAAPAYAQTSEYRIPAGSLKSALDAFARQSGRQIIYKADEIRSARSHGVQGARTAEAALTVLLQGSGFSFRSDTSGAIAIITGEAEAGSVPAEEENADIVVTGTHIQGADAAAPIVTITRKDIERSGYSTAADLLKSLPQSSGGGQNFTVRGAPNVNAGNNSGYISSANLRGAGSDATLTLVNGRRLAYGGMLNGVDVSSIPFGAIERVEVLTDGASAIYGSDAVAGVVNFILRKKFDGFLTTARTGTSTDGGGGEYQIGQLAGANWAGGGVIANYEFYKQDPIYAIDRSFSRTAPAPNSLLPSSEKNSGFVALHQDLTPTLTFSVMGLYTNRSTTDESATTSAGNYLRARVEQYGITPELQLRVGPWQANITIDRAGDRENTDSTAIIKSNGSISRSEVVLTNELTNYEVGASGPLFTLPGGDLQLAFGGGYREEGLNGDYVGSPTSGSRSISFGYGELRIPIIGPINSVPGIRLFQLSASGRYESYSDVGEKFSPKLGIAYKPVNDLTLRGTWGKAFKAPTLFQIYGLRQTAIYPSTLLGIPAPTGSAVLISLGANRSLRPETATSLTAGFDYAPKWASGARFSATYFHIDYNDRIGVAIANLLSAYGNPIYAPFIIRNPTVGQYQDVISNTDLITNLVGSYTPAQVVALIDVRNRNLFRQRISGLDLTASYDFGVLGVKFNAFGNASFLDFRQQNLPTVPEATLTGTIFNPSKFRARGGLQADVLP